MELSIKQFFIFSLQFFVINSFNIRQEITFDSKQAKEIGEYFNKFASFSYCYLGMVEKGECCYEVGSTNNLPNIKGQTINDWTLVEHNTSYVNNKDFKDEENIYSIFKSDEYKKIIVAFTGTETLPQLVTEELLSKHCQSMDCYYQDDKEVCLGVYFEKRIEVIFDRIVQLIKEDLEKKYQIIVVGHSLGGSSAEAFLYKLVKLDSTIKDKNSPIVITYGQPKTGNEFFAKEIRRISKAKYKFVNEGDPVPMVPLVSFFIKKENTREISLKHYRFCDNITTLYIKKDGKIELLSNESPDSYKDKEEKLIKEYEEIYKDAENDQNVNLLISEERRLETIKEEETLLFKEDNQYKIFAEITEEEANNKFKNKASSIIKKYFNQVVDFVTGAKKIVESHTVYLGTNIGSYCSRSNYISLRYLLIISFLIFIN